MRKCNYTLGVICISLLIVTIIALSSCRKRIEQYVVKYDLFIINDSFNIDISYLVEESPSISLHSENVEKLSYYYADKSFMRLPVASEEFKKKMPLYKVTNNSNIPLRIVYVDKHKTASFLEEVLNIRRMDIFWQPLTLTTEQREQIWSDVSNGKYRDFEYQPKTKVIAPGESWYPDWEYYELIPRIL